MVAWFDQYKALPWSPLAARSGGDATGNRRRRLCASPAFEISTRNDFTVTKRREVSLSHLNSLEFYVSYFWSEALWHIPSSASDNAFGQHIDRSQAENRGRFRAHSLALQTVRAHSIDFSVFVRIRSIPRSLISIRHLKGEKRDSPDSNMRRALMV